MTEIAGRLERADRPTLAWRRIDGAGPMVVWLGGYRSDMTGTKAQALADWAVGAGRSFLRFDGSGHGESEGAFEDGAITAWREDALAVIDALAHGPQCSSALRWADESRSWRRWRGQAGSLASC